MSLRPAPTVDQNVNEFGDYCLTYYAQKFNYYVDRFHWLPRFILRRESATRLGNPFNKRISKAGKVKNSSQMEKQLNFNDIKTTHRQHKEITRKLIMIFSRAETGINFIRLSKSISCSLAQIQQQSVHIPEIRLGNR